MKTENHSKIKANKVKSKHADGSVNQPSFEAIIKTVMNKQVQLLAGETSLICPIPGSVTMDKNGLCVGDYVNVRPIGNEQYKLLEVLPRKNAVYRGNRRSGKEDIIIAANIQMVIAVVTAEYLLYQAGYPEAAMIAARRAACEFGIYISKWDRIGEQARNLVEEKMKVYEGRVSFITAGGADDGAQPEISAAVKEKTVLVLGDRGCGKTAFIRKYLSRTAKGAPVSTHTGTLEAAPDKTNWIDTPGFRDFALTAVTAEECDGAFPEIADLAAGCYFSSCTHIHEEGCEVITAVKNRQLSRERYDAYQKLRGPAAETSSREEPPIDYRKNACMESFTCGVCGTVVVPEGAGSQHRNHCPQCLSSVHVDIEPGDRKSLCQGIMEPISVWVRKNGEWAIIHRCKDCGTLCSNRIAADDNPMLLLSIAVKPLAMPPFPLDRMGKTP